MVDDKYYKIYFKTFFLLTQTFPSYYGQGLDVSHANPENFTKRRGIFNFPTGERHTYGPRPRPKRRCGFSHRNARY